MKVFDGTAVTAETFMFSSYYGGESLFWHSRAWNFMLRWLTPRRSLCSEAEGVSLRAQNFTMGLALQKTSVIYTWMLSHRTRKGSEVKRHFLDGRWQGQHKRTHFRDNKIVVQQIHTESLSMNLSTGLRCTYDKCSSEAVHRHSWFIFGTSLGHLQTWVLNDLLLITINLNLSSPYRH